jgi:hypothetical protein
MIYDEASSIPDIIWETSPKVSCLTSTPSDCGLSLGIRLAPPGVSENVLRAGVGILDGPHFKWILDKFHTPTKSGSPILFRLRRRLRHSPRPGQGRVPPRRLDRVHPRRPRSEARSRDAHAQSFDPLVIGVDVARFGDDETVLCFRKGRDARSIPAVRLRGLDTMQVAARVVEESQRLRADAVFVDEGGVGGGVVDRCRQLRLFVFGVQFGGKADRHDIVTQGERYANKRAEMWGSMRAWLQTGAIEDSDDLTRAARWPSYGFNVRDEVQLERKEDMRRRGVPSPDWGDALALTFAYPVSTNDAAGRDGVQTPLYETEYNPFDAAGLVA